jgi:hypothetical protein
MNSEDIKLGKVLKTPKELVGSDGKTYRLHPLDLADFADIDLWLEKYVVERAVRIYGGPEVSPQEKDLRLKEARLLAETISFATVEGVRILNTPAGTQQMLWRSLRHSQPEITLEQTAHLVDATSLVALQEALDEANKLRPKDPTTAQPFPTGG